MRAFLLVFGLFLLAACGKEPESGSAPATPVRWGPEPQEGKANLRLILRVYGKPLDGPKESGLRFRLALIPSPDGSLHMGEFAPDADGRFVCEKLDPGTYTVEVTSTRKDYPEWTLKDVKLAVGASPLLRVDLK